MLYACATLTMLPPLPVSVIFSVTVPTAGLPEARLPNEHVIVPDVAPDAGWLQEPWVA